MLRSGNYVDYYELCVKIALSLCLSLRKPSPIDIEINKFSRNIMYVYIMRQCVPLRL